VARGTWRSYRRHNPTCLFAGISPPRTQQRATRMPLLPQPRHATMTGTAPFRERGARATLDNLPYATCASSLSSGERWTEGVRAWERRGVLPALSLISPSISVACYQTGDDLSYYLTSYISFSAPRHDSRISRRISRCSAGEGELPWRRTRAIFYQAVVGVVPRYAPYRGEHPRAAIPRQHIHR